MGLIHFAPTKGSRCLLKYVQRRYMRVESHFDDQVAVNLALKDGANLTWSGTAVPLPAAAAAAASASGRKRKDLDSDSLLLPHHLSPHRLLSQLKKEEEAAESPSKKILKTRPLRYYTNAHSGIDVGRGAFRDRGASCTGPIRVGLLSHLTVARHCDQLSPMELAEAAALHCLTRKSGKAKFNTASRYKTWLLPEPAPGSRAAEGDDPYGAIAAAVFGGDA